MTTPATIARLSAIALLLICAAAPALACEAGVCDGTVTDDGRPLCWKLRMQDDIPNDVQYFAAGVEHFVGLGPAAYSYLGVGPHDDGNGGPVRQGVNAAGLGLGFNAFNAGDWEELHHYALGFADAVGAVDAYLEAMTTLGTINYYIDAAGGAVLWESDHDPLGHWAYDTRSSARAEVLRDFDEDGDEISYAGWVGRANVIHMHADGTDSLLYGEENRTAAAQTVPGRLIDGGLMSVRGLALEYFRHDVLAWDNTVSNMIVHGVLPTEDPRLTTMWTALGHAEAAVFVPVWLHGVESGGLIAVPKHLDHDAGECVYVPAKGLINDEADEAALQERTLPVEGRFFDVVLDELLPAWRARDWGDAGVVEEIGAEMKRVQERMDADAYGLLNDLYVNGVDNHAPVASAIDGWSADGLTVTLAATAADADGTIIDFLWDYGDGLTGKLDVHAYARAGTYLVSFTATDDDSVSFTDWEFVTVVDPTSVGDGPLGPFAGLRCYPNPFNPRTTVAYELGREAEVRLTVHDVTGRRVRTLLDGARVGAGRREAVWDGRDDGGRRLAAGVYFLRLEAEGRGVTRRVVMLK